MKEIYIFFINILYSVKTQLIYFLFNETIYLNFDLIFKKYNNFCYINTIQSFE